MKNLLIILTFTCLLGSNTYAQGGISFAQGTWKELLAKAEKENKLLFVDAYAEWCGPCKKMAKEVFTQKGVGEYFNKHFVNVKMDMEKGEGIGLSSKFGIQAYPTLLFVDGSGEVVHRAVGYHTGDLLLGLGEAALDPNRNAGALEGRYKKGERSPELLKAVAMSRFEAMDGSYAQVAEEYLATQDNWGSPDNMDFVFGMTNDLDSKGFDFILKNRKAFEERFGEQAVMGKVDELVQIRMARAESEADLKPVQDLYAKVYPAKAAEMNARLLMGYYAQREDWNNYAKATAAYYDKFPASGWEELNEAAWNFYELVDDKKMLKKAAKWAEQSIKLNPNYYNTDTAASVWYKLGKKKKALKAANAAIGLAKAAGEDYTATEMLVEKIKAM